MNTNKAVLKEYRKKFNQARRAYAVNASQHNQTQLFIAESNYNAIKKTMEVKQ